MIYGLVFIIGLILGSFFNVVLSRLDREEGIIKGRSHCPYCHRILAWYELIPILSFIVLLGRCRTCKRPISWRYPIIELLTGILLVGYVARFGIIINFDWLFLLVTVLGFFLLGLFDFYYLILPDKLVFPMIALAFLRIFFYGNQSRLIDLGIGLLLMSFFAILYLVSRGKWLGFGDVKLVLCIGILFGYPGAILILLFSVWIASLVGLLIIILKRGSLKTALPFGSFLCFISIIFILFREQLSFIIQMFS